MAAICVKLVVLYFSNAIELSVNLMMKTQIPGLFKDVANCLQVG